MNWLKIWNTKTYIPFKVYLNLVLPWRRHSYSTILFLENPSLAEFGIIDYPESMSVFLRYSYVNGIKGLWVWLINLTAIMILNFLIVLPRIIRKRIKVAFSLSVVSIDKVGSSLDPICGELFSVIIASFGSILCLPPWRKWGD